MHLIFVHKFNYLLGQRIVIILELLHETEVVLPALRGEGDGHAPGAQLVAVLLGLLPEGGAVVLAHHHQRRHPRHRRQVGLGQRAPPRHRVRAQLQRGDVDGGPQEGPQVKHAYNTTETITVILIMHYCKPHTQYVINSVCAFAASTNQ